jgi:hypothetical protein
MLDRLWKRKSTLDQGAQASLPGRLKVNYWKYFSSFPQESWQQFSPLLNWLLCLGTSLSREKQCRYGFR